MWIYIHGIKGVLQKGEINDADIKFNQRLSYKYAPIYQKYGMVMEKAMLHLFLFKLYKVKLQTLKVTVKRLL